MASALNKLRAQECGLRGGADSPSLFESLTAETRRSRQLCAVPGSGSRSPGTPWPQVLGRTGAVTITRSGRFRVKVFAFRLLADTEFADHVAIAVGIVRLQVIQQTAALTDQLQEATPGSMVLLMGFEVFGQFANPLTQNRNLDLRRAGVRCMSPETFNQGGFLCGRQHGVCYSSCLLRSTLKCLK